MGQIHKTINNKIIDGFGKVTGGNFQINFLTDEVGSYEMVYYVTDYD